MVAQKGVTVFITSILLIFGISQSDKLRKKPYLNPPEWELVDDYGRVKGTWKLRYPSGPEEWIFVDNTGTIIQSAKKNPGSDEFEIDIPNSKSQQPPLIYKEEFVPIGGGITDETIARSIKDAEEANRQGNAYLNSLSEQERKEYLIKRQENENMALVFLLGIFVVAGTVLLVLLASEN